VLHVDINTFVDNVDAYVKAARSFETLPTALFCIKTEDYNLNNCRGENLKNYTINIPSSLYWNPTK
jgi:hypothetical protein